MLGIILVGPACCQKSRGRFLNIRTLFNQISPPRCLLCDKSGAPICPACLADLPHLDPVRCPVCALPSGFGNICGHCLKNPPAFDRTTALLAYDFPVDRLIQRLKYAEYFPAAPLFGTMLAEHVAQVTSCPPQVFLPMPLHIQRLKERGFNQAVEIAREFSRRTGIAMQTNWVERVRDTPPQAGLKRDARRKNLRGAFATKAKVNGLHIGIVDDVMTTGSTLDALAATLKQAGAAQISCWVVARA